MKNNILIGIVGADSTGKTTLAKAIADHYGGHHHSVHQFLLPLFFKKNKKKEVCPRSELLEFANKLRRTKNNPAIIVEKIITRILKRKNPGLIALESIFVPGEIDFLHAICADRMPVIIFGIRAYPQDRIDWMKKSGVFPVEEENAAVLFTAESRDWCLADPLSPNIDGCFEKIPEEHIFDNEGENCIYTTIFPAVKKILDERINTPL
jgi:hypothetical protein